MCVCVCVRVCVHICVNACVAVCVHCHLDGHLFDARVYVQDGTVARTDDALVLQDGYLRW